MKLILNYEFKKDKKYKIDWFNFSLIIFSYKAKDGYLNMIFFIFDIMIYTKYFWHNLDNKNNFKEEILWKIIFMLYMDEKNLFIYYHKWHIRLKIFQIIWILLIIWIIWNNFFLIYRSRFLKEFQSDF